MQLRINVPVSFPDEKLIYQANPNLIFLLAPVAGLIFFWAVLWFGSCPTLDIISLKSLCHLAASLVILFSIAVIYLDWHYNRFYLTNYRVIKERGIIGKKFVSVWLYKIQDLTVEIGIWGRIFRFGDLLIESAGRFGQMSFRGFPGPERIMELIGEEIQRISS
jgi:uncharacterized membrane protein YdbT with pleckstrin-like domain